MADGRVLSPLEPAAGYGAWRRRYALWPAVLALGYYVTIVRIAGVPCPMRAGLGVDCPFCGFTRGMAALARGDLTAALRDNPLSVAALPLIGIAIAVACNDVGRVPALVRHTRVPALVLLILWTVMRNTLVRRWCFV